MVNVANGRFNGIFESPVFRGLTFALFLVLVSHSIVGYGPYRMAWDDLYLFHRSLCVHNAIYNLRLNEVAGCLSFKPPLLTFMTLPWGPAASGEAGVALGFIGLAIFLWLVVLTAYYVGRASSASTGALLLAALSIWLNPFLASQGGIFMADMLLAWITVLLMLLVPLELSQQAASTRADLARGTLWGIVIAIGLLTKVNFGFFLAVIGPTVLWIRMRSFGLQSALRTTGTALIWITPALVIWVVSGKLLFQHAIDGSFGEVSRFFGSGASPVRYLLHFAAECGYGLLPAILLAGYFGWKVSSGDHRLLRILPVALTLVYLVLCSLSFNQDYRFAMPAMVGVPFLLAVIPVETSKIRTVEFSWLISGLLGGVLCSVPMLARPDLTYVRYAGAVLDRIARPGVKIVLATDDRYLNVETFILAKEIRAPRLNSVSIETLVYDIVYRLPIEESYRHLASADFILYKRPPLLMDPKWVNQNAGEFYRRILQVSDRIEAPSEFMEVFRVRH